MKFRLIGVILGLDVGNLRIFELDLNFFLEI